MSSRRHKSSVIESAKSVGRSALKQYGRVTGAASSVIDLPSKWAGSLLKANPKSYRGMGLAQLDRIRDVVAVHLYDPDFRDRMRARDELAKIDHAIKLARKARRNGKNPGNPESGADRMYESFHGRKAEGETKVVEGFHQHEWLAPLGVWVNMRVATLRGDDAFLGTSDDAAKSQDFDETAANEDTVFLSSNEAGTQLYFVGGDQSVDLNRLKFTGDWVKDDMIIGVLYEITYRTKKKFDKFQLTDYFHHLGEETGDQPMLRYDPLSPHCYVTGGRYKIKVPLIGMSPGIEN